MKKLMLIVLLFVLAGCGSGGGGSTPAQQSAADIAAAKLTKASEVTGTWAFTYSVGNNHYAETLHFGTVSPVNIPPFDFESGIITSNLGRTWIGGYTSVNETWTIVYSSSFTGEILGSKAYEFKTENNLLSAGSCCYLIQSNGTRSACMPLIGIKTSNTP